VSGETQRLLVVYHTMTGGTQQMVAAAARAATGETGVEVAVLRAEQADATQVLEADGYLFATPENLASMSGMMKDFFDRTYYDALEHVAGRPYAAMICAGSDGQGAARQLERIALGWRLKPVAPTLVVITHAQTPEAIRRTKIVGAADLQRCAVLGAAMAAGLALGVF
jgi:multimeric flavodoxin WrbA